MIITEIKFKPNKKTCDIFFDNGTILNLTAEALVKHRFSLGVEIDENDLSNANKESNKTKALEMSINYLSKGFRTEQQLKKYLKDKKFDVEIQNFVVEKLKDYDYINDANLAKLFVEQSSKKMGKQKIIAKMYEKGLSKKLIEENISLVENQDELCLQMAQKKWSSLSKELNTTANSQEKMQNFLKQKSKLARFLTSQGFEWETIKSCLRKVCQNGNYDDEF